MTKIKEHCYALSPLCKNDNPFEFSLVFKDPETASKVSADTLEIKVNSDSDKPRVFHLAESGIYLPGRVTGEVLWRLLNECEGDRLLHTPQANFGNVHVKNERFAYLRDRKGFGEVKTNLPTTRHIAEAVISISPELQTISYKQRVYKGTENLCQEILDALREKKFIDADARLSELIK